MTSLRYVAPSSLLILLANFACGATPREIQAAIALGSGYLRDSYKEAKPKQLAGGQHGIGPAALAGLALLESGVSPEDPALRAITTGVRDASFTATQTYQIALCLLYLDRLGELSDIPLIQMLGVRLVAGQTANGGWTYDCIESVPPQEERTLRSALMTAELSTVPLPNPSKPGGGTGNPGKNPAPGKPGAVGRLHAEVEKYQGRLAAFRVRARNDDNSNTQFGVLGTWVARKHGVPVEAVLDLIEVRFLKTQTINGGWPYSGLAQGSPSMTCAGLLGLATAIGRREEKRMQTEMVKTNAKPQLPKSPPSDPPKPAPKNEDPFFNPVPTPPKPDDPFFTPIKPPAEPAPAPAKNPDAKPAPPKHPADVRDRAIQKALASLGDVLAGNVAAKGRGRGPRFLIDGGGNLGERDLYFLWSVERVGVVYGLEKIGNIDWYEVGAEELTATQNVSGSWGRGGRGAEVDTAFAVLFLARSNLVVDLTRVVQHGSATAELRAGAGPIGGELPGSPNASKPVAASGTKPPLNPEPAPAPGRRTDVTVIRPTPASGGDPKALAAELIGATDMDWRTLLIEARDAKGSDYTQALVIAISSLEGERMKSAREALADRLTRMTSSTLRTMAKAKEPELRRGAVLAMAMKDDKECLDELIAAIVDPEDIVVRAAKAGLKSLTGEDFGPPANADAKAKQLAAKAWLQWYEKQSK